MPADRLIHPKLGHSEKIARLSFLERAVWFTYILAADDYGIVRQSATTFQAADDGLDKEPKEVIQAAIATLVEVGLCEMFLHQGRRYLCQLTWQNEQRVKHPRDSMNPVPPADVFAKATPATQKLWAQHNSLRSEHPEGVHGEASGSPLGGEREADGSRTGNEREADGSHVGASRAGAGAKRLTANGYRLTATEGVQGEIAESPPMDVWARELVNLYPAQGRCGWNQVERPLYGALTGDPEVSPWLVWDRLKTRLEQHQRSHQWRVKGMIPRLDKWLREGLYLQELPESPPSTLITDKTAGTLAAAAEILKGRAS